MVGSSKESAGAQQKYQQDKKKPLSLDDCDRPACDDIVAKMQQAAAAASQQQHQQEDNCPATSSVLGRATWTLMHTMAAWYPEKPTQQDQREMSQFMSAVARFYPCSWCAQDFQENLAESPVRTSSRKELCQWLCEQHNIVNVKTGKPIFSCEMKDLDERWRKSSNEKCKSTHMGPH